MIYIQLNEAGEVCGTYANPQPQPDGSCLTEADPVLETDPRVVPFLNPPKVPKPLTDGDLAAVLVKAKVITQAQVDAATATLEP